MALLENETIRLRALEPEDLDVLYRWENDSELWACGSTLAPYSKYALKEYISESRQDIYHSRQLRLMVILKENEAPVGTIDLYEFDPMNLRAGIGILLDTDYRRKGLGIQVLNLMQQYAFEFLFLKQLFAYIPQRNENSLKLFTRCGYKQMGQLKEWLKRSDFFEDVYIMQFINNEQD